ncbi:MAG: sterol desaturase family protein [Proteobacteria bacterium]|nr:sterol desaturase family protein [Burkholderiales bacterium]
MDWLAAPRSAAEFAALVAAYFFFLYWAFALLCLLATRVVFPAVHLGRVLDTRRLRSHQRAAEIGGSMMTVAIFGIGSLTVWWGLRHGWLRVDTDASLARIVIEAGVLVLWNDAHFYACHWLLHRRALFERFHLRHHRSGVVTPFATYSFSPVEAALLGSVMPLAMLAWNFSVEALLFLPVYSLLINTIGHSNYDLFPARRIGQLSTFSRRHQMHHARFHGNYGFMLPWFDTLLRTRTTDLRPEAASGLQS